MTAILVDTDVLIEVLRERDPVMVEEWLRLAASSEPVFYSPVTAALQSWHGVGRCFDRVHGLGAWLRALDA